MKRITFSCLLALSFLAIKANADISDEFAAPGEVDTSGMSQSFDPTQCDDEGSYEPKKCKEHAERTHPSTVAKAEEVFNPAHCQDDGSYEPEKCKEYAEKEFPNAAKKEFNPAHCDSEFNSYEPEKCSAVFAEKNKKAIEDSEAKAAAEARAAAEEKAAADAKTAAFDPSRCDDEGSYEPQKCKANAEKQFPSTVAKEGTRTLERSAGSSAPTGAAPRVVASSTPAEGPKVKSKGIFSDTLDTGDDNERFTIERNRFGVFYKGPSDMTPEERARAESRVAQIKETEQAAKDRELLAGSKPELKVKKSGFISDTLDMGAEEGKHRFTIERNRLGVFYQGPTDMTPEERAQAEAMVEKYRAAERQSGRSSSPAAGTTTSASRTEAPARPAASPSGPPARAPVVVAGFDPSQCDDEGSYQPQNCKKYAESAYPTTVAGAGSQESFNPAFCQDDGSYEEKKCKEYAEKLYPSTVAKAERSPAAQTQPFNPDYCGDDLGQYEPEKCKPVMEARNKAAIEEQAKKEKVEQQARARRIASERKKQEAAIAAAQAQTQKNMASLERRRAAAYANCEELKKQGEQEFFEKFAGKYKKLYNDCIQKVEADFGSYGH